MRRRALLTRILPGALLSPALAGCARPGSGPAGGEGRVLDEPGSFSNLPPQPLERASSAFWDRWGDGRAELSGYRVVTPRYGESRDGELVLVYVTEPHDRRIWIKDDEVGEPHRVNVLKLNVSLKFLAGIYPYSVMTSVFAPVDRYGPRRFSPVKLSLGSQEWCGNYFHEVWPGPGTFRSLRLSYFASEGESLDGADVPEGTLYEDALLIQLRELDGPFAGGGDWEGWLVPRLWDWRSRHREGGAVRATLRRSETLREEVPVTRFRLELEREGGTRTFDVEREPPRRILGWTTSEGEEARLVRSRRLAYWRLNAPGNEEEREKLGLRTEGYAPLPGSS